MKKITISLKSTKNNIKKVLVFLLTLFFDFYYTKSYSQEGEDVLLKRIFKNKPNGFYVDIGAHHPRRYSNTYLFYKSGWNGINIDAMPSSMSLFKILRRRDINLEIGISEKKGNLDYYIFNDGAINTFLPNLAKKRSKEDKFYIKSIINLQVEPLKNVFEKYVGDKKIDFLTIDVEGLDLSVLKSNDWNKYKPSFILVEILDLNLSNLNENLIYIFLKNHGYSLEYKTYYTCFFKLN